MIGEKVRIRKMGVDLTMLPFGNRSEGNAFSHTLLDCNRSRELFDEIFAIEKEHGEYVPPEFVSYCSRDGKYEEPHYGSTLETPYGERLQYVEAQRLYALIQHPHVQDNYPNRAVWAYISCLPRETKIALYWH